MTPLTEAETTASLAALVATFPPMTAAQRDWWAHVDRGVLALPDWQMHRAELRRAGEDW